MNKWDSDEKKRWINNEMHLKLFFHEAINVSSPRFSIPEQINIHGGHGGKLLTSAVSPPMAESGIATLQHSHLALIIWVVAIGDKELWCQNFILCRFMVLPIRFC